MDNDLTRSPIETRAPVLYCFPPRSYLHTQTNNKGTFVLQDFAFRPLRHLSGTAPSEAQPLALRHVVSACGLVRGALAAFGLDAAVNADVSAQPRVVFTVRLAGAGE